jgi:hypothetical protein
MLTETWLTRTSGLKTVSDVISPRRMKLAPSRRAAERAASGSFLKYASISAWAICRRISSGVYVVSPSERRRPLIAWKWRP